MSYVYCEVHVSTHLHVAYSLDVILFFHLYMPMYCKMYVNMKDCVHELTDALCPKNIDKSKILIQAKIPLIYF